MFKYNTVKIRRYILIILTTTIFFLNSISDSNTKENIFIVRDIKIEGPYNVNFSREKFVDIAIRKSFKKLSSDILLLKDKNELENLKLKKIKTLIRGFRILEESFIDKKYFATFEVMYNDIKIKKLLSEKNISYYDPKNTTVVFFPILFIKDEIKIFNDNYFYKNWSNSLEDNTIKYILPIEDIDDILSINSSKNEIEEVDFNKLASKYDIKNYAVSIITYKPGKLKVYLKTSLDTKKYNKNIFYDLKDLNNESKLNMIIEDLQLKILDMWKRANLINIPLPLNIQIKYKYKDLSDLNILEKTLNDIHIINNHSLEKFDFKNSFYNINYSGDPKKLREEFLRFNYLLRDDQGSWELVKK